jgi:hypothetical protein
MAFIEKKDPVVLNIKLTTKGRELLSTGNLTFKYFAIGDSEMDYGFNKATGFNPFYASILRPADNAPNIISFIPKNLSGDPYYVIPSIPASTYLVTNTAPSIGFFTNITGSSFTFIVDGNHVKQPDVMINMSGIAGGKTLNLRKGPNYGTSGAEPAVGDLLLVKWTVNVDTTGYTTQKSRPTPFLMYRIDSVVSGTLAANNLVVLVDREIPDLTGIPAAGRAGALVYYNYINFTGSTIFTNFSTDYLDESVLTFLQNSQCPTVVFPFWNMSIIFTDEIAGVQMGDKKYGEFHTNKYGGFVSYIQSQQPFYKKLGVIHYTNSSPANVYAEGFYLNTARLEVPTIMWHKNSTKKLGATFVASGNGFTLVDLGIHYYNLVDINNPNIVVGKVFDELKMFLIEDQELLYAMSYKSNRSWTLPEFSLNGGSGGCPPVPPAPPVLFVQTIIGTPGSIKNTGGFNIVGYENVTEYGVEYKTTGATDWIRVKVGTTLAVNTFSYTITGTTSSTAYNYRAYIRVNNNEYIDHSNDGNAIHTLPAPPPPPPPPPVISPSVLTTLGVAGIGRIDNTGGNTIPANVFIAVEKYGMKYKLSSLADVPQNWTLSPAVALSGPLAVNNFTIGITGLAENTSYDYKAYIQVAGVIYDSLTFQTTTTLAQPVPQFFAPSVTSGLFWKQLAKISTIDVLTRNNSVDDNGGTTIIEYGILYTQDPAKNDPALLVYGGAGISKASITADIAEGLLYQDTMPDLFDSSPIFFRAFATNSVGIGYGTIQEGTTIALQVIPQQAQIYICGICQLGANTDVRSCVCAHLGVSSPMGSGSVRLWFTDCALSQAFDPLQRNITACAWINLTSQTGAACCNFVSSSLNIGSTSCSANEGFAFVDVDASNISNIVLHAVTGSHASNAAIDYANVASVNLICVDNSGGANYSIGTSTLQAYNTSCCVGGGGGGIVAAV